LSVDRSQRVWELVQLAGSLEPGKREAFLTQACAGDDSLRAEVLAQLRLQGGRQAGQPSTGTLNLTSGIGEALEHRRVASYRLEGLIGAGGMGAVYRAVQEQPHRTVALKVMRSGIGSPSALRRFHYESEILARLRHPGIAHVYEAGMHEEGVLSVPYFVMEHIPDARSLTEYVEWKGMETRQRLELFAKVCDAVHHAHQKGVIHRDLKPSNILVDSSGQPKLIDFGVARVPGADIALTDAGSLVGTLPYMSPEQCQGEAQEIDTRSDVYALGVVLYELLCGQLPQDLAQKPLSDAVRMIREERPRRPSTIHRALRGDVETITLKTLEKDRERRYPSAAELAEDIRRYLRNEPITARPASGIYHLRKLVSRHKLPSALLVVLLGVLLAFTINMDLQSRRIARERDKAERINTFLQRLLAGADPELSGHDVTGAQLLDRAAAGIAGDLQGEPEVEEAVRAILGAAYRNLGRYADAERELRSALALRRQLFGEKDLGVARHMVSLAIALGDQKRASEAEELTRHALSLQRELLGEEHIEVSNTLHSHAVALKAMGRTREAEEELLQALAMRRKLEEDDVRAADVINSLAVLHEQVGRFDEAEKRHREALAIAREHLTPDHSDIAKHLNNLASALLRRNDTGEAAKLWQEALEIWTRRLGEDHPRVATVLGNLGLVHGLRGDHRQAEACYRRALDIRRRKLGPKNPDVTNLLVRLAGSLQNQGDLAGAEGAIREALEIDLEQLGAESLRVSTDRSQLAFTLLEQGKAAEAEAEVRKALPVLERSLPQSRFDHASALLMLGKTLIRQDRAAEAEPLLRNAAVKRQEMLGDQHWQTAYARLALGECLAALGRRGEAESLLVESHAVLKSSLNPRHPRALEALRGIIALYEAWGKDNEAATYKAQLEAGGGR